MLFFLLATICANIEYLMSLIVFQIKAVKITYSGMRDDIDDVFDTIYHQAERMAAAVNVDPVKPRTAGKQQHRANASSTSVKDHWQPGSSLPGSHYFRA